MGRQRFDERSFEKGDHAARRITRPARRGEAAFAVFLLLAVLAPALPAADSATSAFRVWLEPKFMRAPVTMAIPGSKKTEIAAGYISATDQDVFAKAAFDVLGMTWEEFQAVARQNAAADLAEIEPRFVRDSAKVITYAALESKRPIVAAAVLAPGFLAKFKDTLGESLLVVVPNRFTAFAFPKLASEFAGFAPMVLRAYRETAWPVSLEVFEVDAKGWRCVGTFENP